MNQNKIEKLFALMKQYGVSYLKNNEIEIKIQEPSNSVNAISGSVVSIPIVNPVKSETKIPDPQAIPPVESKIPHHVNEVADLLKLSDADLVDKLFPDYSQLVPKEGE